MAYNQTRKAPIKKIYPKLIPSTKIKYSAAANRPKKIVLFTYHLQVRYLAIS